MKIRKGNTVKFTTQGRGASYDRVGKVVALGDVFAEVKVDQPLNGRTGEKREPRIFRPRISELSLA